MRISVLGVVLATFAGAASAGDLEYVDQRYYDSNDYAARAYYRVDFGGTQRTTQSLGLRFDNERALSNGAPSMLHVTYGELGLGKISLNGFDVRGAALAANQGGISGFFSNLSVAQWFALVITAGVFTSIAVEAADSEDVAAPTGTGTGGT
jgi:hypothetical protein